MRHFLQQLLLFLLPIALLAVGAECYMRCCVPNSYRIKAELMERTKDSVEAIVLGNSHAYSGIKPDLLPGVAVNMANVSQVLDTDLRLLERYAPQCPCLKQVYLVCDNSNLFDLSLEQTDEWFRCTYYTLYMDGLGGHSRWSRYGLELAHFNSFRGKLTKYWHLQRPDCDPLGWDTDNSLQAKREAGWDSTQVADALRRHTCNDWQQARRNARTVMEMARYCQTRGIRLTLLCTPVTPAYAAGVPPRQLEAIRRVHKEACQKYGAESLDLSRTEAFAPDDYFDSDHLTHEGAAKLTRLLARSAH